MRGLEPTEAVAALASWTLSPRQALDLGQVLCGGFAPLSGFLSRADHASVLASLRLASGDLWPIPVCLDVSAAFGDSLTLGERVALRRADGRCLAILATADVFRPDLRAEAVAVFGTADEEHPGVRRLLRETHPVYVGGSVEPLDSSREGGPPLPFPTPAVLRERFATLGWTRVVGFQTRNPLHGAHVALALRAMRDADAALLLHPVVGDGAPGDVPDAVRIAAYEAVMPRFPAGSALLSLLPLSMRMAGPREALWHALIRKNHGCTHFVVGRDHASPGPRADGRPFYAPFDAHDLVRRHAAQLGIEVLLYDEMVWLEDEARFVERREVPEGARVRTCSGSEVRRRLGSGLPIPGWMSFPEVAEVLRRSAGHRRTRGGFVVFLTGLPAAGKTTLARVLRDRLEEAERAVTFLDGDEMRRELSPDLGFSRADRDLHVRRLGFVAAEAARHGGVAIVAVIAPYRAARAEVRGRVEAAGGAFVEVHVATSLATCAARDPKGLYAAARAGRIRGLTGVDDPYEAPEHPEVCVDAGGSPPGDCAGEVFARLRALGLVG